MSGGPSAWLRLARRAAPLFAVALAVRLLYLLSIRHAFFFDHLQTEPQRYDEWARAIVDGTAPVRPPFDEAPAYPYFVALLYALFGGSIAAVAFAQALLDALGCVAIAVVGWRIGGARAGWIAGTLAALCGPLVYFTGQLEPATLAVCAVAVALAATPGDAGEPRWRWTAAGALWGGALLVRSEAILALPSVLLHAWSCGGRRLAARAALVPSLLLAGSLTVNALSSGHAVLLTTGGGVNLWLGNNAHADGVNPFLHGPLEAVAAEVAGRAHDAVEADALFRERAFDFFRERPGDALRLLGKKLAWTVGRRELPNASDIEWQTSQSWLFRGSPALPVGFGVLLPLAVAGALLFGRDWRRRLALTAPLAIGVTTCVVFFTNARFRLALMPSLLPLAALAIDRVLASAPAWRRSLRPLALAVAGVAAGALVSWTDLFGVRGYQVPQIAVNTGVLEAGAGQLDGAVRHFRDGLRGDPDDAGAWIQLGLTLERAGRLDEARATWQEALAHLPADPVVRRTAAAHLVTAH